MEIKGKRILITCREDDSRPFYFLIKDWMKYNEVAAYFIKASESGFKKNPSNESTYYAFKKNISLKVYDVNSIAEIFINIRNDDNVIDQFFLEKIEKEYTHFKNINTQIISSQSFNRHYHYRYFWSSCTYQQQLNWLILCYKDALKVLDEFQPDVVINTDSDEISRNALREICYKRDIPNVTLDFPRFDDYLIYTYNLGNSVNIKFEEYFKSCEIGNKIDLSTEVKYVEDYRKKAEIKNKSSVNSIDYQYYPESFLKVVKFWAHFIILLFKQDVIAGNWKIKRSNQILYPSTMGYIKYFLHYTYYKQRLMRRNKMFQVPRNDERYVYMPLHLIPESTTSILTPFYVNELSVIEAVSKSLPAGWMLYVKEHQAMIGERSIEFYKAVNRLPNAKMVQLNYYNDPKPWITKSQGVVTLSGTAAYEAAMLGKHAVVFSNVPFSLIEGIHRVDSFEDLPRILKSFVSPLNNIKSCASYLRTVKEFGERVDFVNLNKACYQAISNDEELDESCMNKINYALLLSMNEINYALLLSMNEINSAAFLGFEK